MTGACTAGISVVGLGAETGAVTLLGTVVGVRAENGVVTVLGPVLLVCAGLVTVAVAMGASAGATLGAVAAIVEGVRAGFPVGAKKAVVVGVAPPFGRTVAGDSVAKTAGAACAGPPALGVRKGEPALAVERAGAAVAAATTEADHGSAELAALMAGIWTRADWRLASFLASSLPASRILGETVLMPLGATSVCIVTSASFEWNWASLDHAPLCPCLCPIY
jgi:hypothetical protein